jgi:DNA-binding GntR family transcriptional regulator
LPSRQALAEEYGYTHMTVARALNILKDEGLIYDMRSGSVRQVAA